MAANLIDQQRAGLADFQPRGLLDVACRFDAGMIDGKLDRSINADIANKRLVRIALVTAKLVVEMSGDNTQIELPGPSQLIGRYKQTDRIRTARYTDDNDRVVDGQFEPTPFGYQSPFKVAHGVTYREP